MLSIRFSTLKEENLQFTVHNAQLFKKYPISVSNVLRGIMRNQGLETPLLQRRVVAAWDEVIRSLLDEDIAEYVIKNTVRKDVRNQTLWIEILSPAIRADLQLKCSDLIAALNNKVGAQIVTSIRFY